MSALMILMVICQIVTFAGFVYYVKTKRLRKKDLLEKEEVLRRYGVSAGLILTPITVLFIVVKLTTIFMA